jgi:hypothetical protein
MVTPRFSQILPRNSRCRSDFTRLHKIEPRELGRISATTLIERWPELAGSVQREKIPSLFE